MKKSLLIFLFAIQAHLLFSHSQLEYYIYMKGGHIVEGHLIYDSPKAEFLRDLLNENPDIQRIAETGFNAGHSSQLFLSNTTDAEVVSFDIMQWNYAHIGKQFIDQNYPGRHTLIEGDSLVSVVEYSENHPAETFDLIFVDGGHEYEVAKGDIVNFQKLAHPETLLIVDDTNAVSVNRAWQECLEEGIIEEIEAFQAPDADWVLGRYVLEEEEE